MNYPTTYRVTIVGGGPVGLFLAACLHRIGISCIILEKRAAPRSGSRSIGIHPVSLELFEKLGIAELFTQKGIKISYGYAFANNRKIGTLSFEECPKPFNFVLALPQTETEHILERYVQNLSRVLILRDAKVVDFNQTKDNLNVSFEHEGSPQTVKSTFLVGCDGKNSIVRKKAGISFEGRSYPDSYIMGDFSDNTHLGSDAAIFLCDEGLIESFPLPDNKRRWVVKIDAYHSSVSRSMIEREISHRINHSLSGLENSMLSSFGVQKYLAKPMVKGRVILAGDAAHVVSPIGGQGMNLGWLGAWDLAESLNKVINQRRSPLEVLKTFEKRRTKAAKRAIRRAELNMFLGRKAGLPFIRNGLVSLMLNTPLSRLMSQMFTMRGIEHWII